MSTVNNKKSHPQLRRRLFLAALSSAALVICLLVESSDFLEPLGEYQEALKGAVAGSTFVVAFLLFGAFVLVPHIPKPKRHPARIFAVVVLPLLWLGPAAGLVVGLAAVLELFLYPYSDLYWILAYLVGGALAGALWVLGLAAALTVIARLEKQQAFWRYTTFAAMSCAIPIALTAYIFYECFLASCAQWLNNTLIFLVYFTAIVTPVALSAALHFGASDQSA